MKEAMLRSKKWKYTLKWQNQNMIFIKNLRIKKT
jgi:hypothetical protein